MQASKKASLIGWVLAAAFIFGGVGVMVFGFLQRDWNIILVGFAIAGFPFGVGLRDLWEQYKSAKKEAKAQAVQAEHAPAMELIEIYKSLTPAKRMQLLIGARRLLEQPTEQTVETVKKAG